MLDYVFLVIVTAICLWEISVGWRNYRHPKDSTRLSFQTKALLALGGKYGKKNESYFDKKNLVRQEGMFAMAVGALVLVGMAIVLIYELLKGSL